MPTLITTKYQGKVTGQCDAKCYDATAEKCLCICGGVNHGVGHNQAQKNTTDIVKHLLINLPKAEVTTDGLQQLGLFG